MSINLKTPARAEEQLQEFAKYREPLSDRKGAAAASLNDCDVASDKRLSVLGARHEKSATQKPALFRSSRLGQDCLDAWQSGELIHSCDAYGLPTFEEMQELYVKMTFSVNGSDS